LQIRAYLPDREKHFCYRNLAMGEQNAHVMGMREHGHIPARGTNRNPARGKSVHGETEVLDGRVYRWGCSSAPAYPKIQTTCVDGAIGRASTR
jgi:hypothetical protein